MIRLIFNRRSFELSIDFRDDKLLNPCACEYHQLLGNILSTAKKASTTCALWRQSSLWSRFKPSSPQSQLSLETLQRNKFPLTSWRSKLSSIIPSLPTRSLWWRQSVNQRGKVFILEHTEKELFDFSTKRLLSFKFLVFQWEGEWQTFQPPLMSPKAGCSCSGGS